MTPEAAHQMLWQELQAVRERTRRLEQMVTHLLSVNAVMAEAIEEAHARIDRLEAHGDGRTGEAVHG